MIAAAVLAASLLADPAAAIRLPVPVMAQAPERCGPAALAMVLRFYGADSSVAATERAYDPVLHGALITDLAGVARRAGFDAAVAEVGEDSLRALLSEHVPPVLLIHRGAGPIAVAHYAVLVGWDPVHGRYAVNDGSRATRRMARDGLMRQWRAAGSLALIVRPRR